MAKSNGTGLLSGADILNADDLRDDVVDVPEWGGRVRIRAMTGGERQEFDESLMRVSQKAGEDGATIDFHAHRLRLKLCSMVMIDADGHRLFPKPDDVARLAQKSAAALQRVYERAAELSGLSREAVEEAAKNSEAAPVADSHSESLAN